MQKIQKPPSRKTSIDPNKPATSPFLQQYRLSIQPDYFTFRQLQIYDSLSKVELESIETSTIEHQQFRRLVVDGLQLTFLFNPVKEMLAKCQDQYIDRHSIKNIARILHRGQFYRFINNGQHRIAMLINNRTTQANAKIVLAAVIVFATKRLRIEEISTSLLFFSLEAALNPDPVCLPPDSQKILKVLKKIQRIIKPNQFKRWFQAVKNSTDFSGFIQAHHFIYLCSLTQRKFSNELQNVIFQPKISSLFKNLNINVRTSDFQNQVNREQPQKKNKIYGLSFAEPMKRNSFSVSKQILKQFRLRDPSKNKIPNTSELKKRVKSFSCVLRQPPTAEKKRPKLPNTQSLTSNTINNNSKMNISPIGTSPHCKSKLAKTAILKRPKFGLKIIASPTVTSSNS